MAIKILPGSWNPSPLVGWFFFPVPSKPQTQCEPKEKQSSKNGCDCKKCKNYFPYAEPNQEDGTLICWACRNGY